LVLVSAVNRHQTTSPLSSCCQRHLQIFLADYLLPQSLDDWQWKKFQIYSFSVLEITPVRVR
jgi:hypothetical protein